MLLILEDNPYRIRNFRKAAKLLNLKVLIFPTTHDMIRDLPAHLPAATLISLDHDLTPIDGRDPGDGLDVAKFLVSQPIARPVLIHSSNADRATQMMGEFELAHWPAARVLPLGESWIEDDWLPTARQLLRSR